MTGTTFEPTTDTLARGELIRNAREEKQLTHQQLAGRVGASRPSVIYWEQGRVNEIELKFVLKLYEVLGIPPHFLFSEEQRRFAASLQASLHDAIRESAAQYAPRRRQSKRSIAEVSDPALSLAIMWERLPTGDEAKEAAKALIEQAHAKRYPKYKDWETERELDSQQRPASRGKSRKPSL